MSEPETQPHFVTCRCQVCDGRIEFDASGFKPGETRTVECPHCSMETLLFVPPVSKTPKAAGQAMSASPTSTALPSPPSNEKLSLMAQMVPLKPLAALPSSPSQIELFFYKIGNIEKGPYTFEQLRSLWSNGQITADALYRPEQLSNWMPLSVRMGQQSQGSFLPLAKLHNLLLRGVCALSLIAFFLPNASISLPIFGKAEVSMFDFLTPKSDKTTDGEAKPQKPNIKNVIDSNDFQIKKPNLGALICGLSVLGVLLHYLLTLVWGVLALVLKRTFSLLDVIWLSLALQFPVLFSIGAHMAITAIKTSAMSDAGNDTGDNSPAAALGTALGAALLNHISMQPGPVMWILMIFAALGMSLPLLARQTTPAAAPVRAASPTPKASEKAPESARVEITRLVNPVGIASLALGIIACILCWIPLLTLLVIPLALIGFALAIVGLIMAVVSKRTGLAFPVSGGIVCILSVCIALLTTGGFAKLIATAMEEAKKTSQTSVEQTEAAGHRGGAVNEAKETDQTSADQTQRTSDRGAVANESTKTDQHQSPPTRPVSSENEWSRAQSVKQGDIQITLTKTYIETQRSIAWTEGHDPRYKNLVLTNGFALEIEIKNLGPSKIVRGNGWSGQNNITLTDSFGNQYPQNTYRNPDYAWITPRLLHEFTLYPNQSITDFIRFETLVKNVEWAHLELPANNFGGTGVIRFEIPASQIVIQWPPPY